MATTTIYTSSDPGYVNSGAAVGINTGDATGSSVLVVSTEVPVPTYAVAINAHAPAATPTDWFTIQGSATKVIHITSIAITLRATAVTQYRVSLIKYSVFLTGGTAATPTIVPYDSGDAAATALVNTWAGGLPTPGTAIGKVADDSLAVSSLGTPTLGGAPIVYTFGLRNQRSLILRGTTQYLALNSNAVALPAGLVADVRIEWAEYPL